MTIIKDNDNDKDKDDDKECTNQKVCKKLRIVALGKQDNLVVTDEFIDIRQRYQERLYCIR